MLVHAVVVAPGRVRLPDFNEQPLERPAVFVQYATAHHDTLAQRLALVLAREVVVVGVDVGIAEDRCGELRKRMRQHDERLGRRALDRRSVGRKEVVGLRAAVRASVAHSASGCFAGCARSKASSLMHCSNTRIVVGYGAKSQS